MYSVVGLGWKNLRGALREQSDATISIVKGLRTELTVCSKVQDTSLVQTLSI